MVRAADILARGMRTPDVIATGFEDIALLEAQTHAAACWLSLRCDAALENAHDQIRINAREQDQLIRDLNAAGFAVLKLKS